MMFRKIMITAAMFAVNTALAGPICFNDVKDYYAPSTAAQACSGVDETCFSNVREYYGPMVSAQTCKLVSHSCFEEMYQYVNGPVQAANLCAPVDETCFVYMRDRLSGPQQAANSCKIVTPRGPRGGTRGGGGRNAGIVGDKIEG